MSVLVGTDTRLVVQGITGQEGSYHARRCRDYGTKLVAGVTPGKGGSFFDGVPVFNTVREAVQKQGANTSMILVPPRFAADAVLEAVDAELDWVICITEGVPVQEMMKIKEYLKNKKSRLLGPNCPGAISPVSRTKVGIIPLVGMPGRVGLMTRSGSLAYEIVSRLLKAEIGQSTCLGIGGDHVVGTTFSDCLLLFEKDPDTDAIVIGGEIGGSAEEEAAELIKTGKITKPVIAYVAGLTAPAGKRMGHAGAIISGGQGSAKDKLEAFRTAGAIVAENLEEISEKVLRH